MSFKPTSQVKTQLVGYILVVINRRIISGMASAFPVQGQIRTLNALGTLNTPYHYFPTLSIDPHFTSGQLQ